jgi:hypothetical protein
MYIVAIAWLYVALMMAITEPSLIGGVLSFLFYGLLPLALLLWLFGGPARRRARMRADAAATSNLEREAPMPPALSAGDEARSPASVVVPDDDVHQPNRDNTEANQRQL